jgi:hypothetical protein
VNPDLNFAEYSTSGFTRRNPIQCLELDFWYTDHCLREFKSLRNPMIERCSLHWGVPMRSDPRCLVSAMVYPASSVDSVFRINGNRTMTMYER